MLNHIVDTTIGCDLGDKTSTLCIIGPDGRVERPKAIKTTQEGFRGFFTRPAAHVVIEVGAHSRWVSALLKELGHRVTVANAHRVKLISQNNSKSDQVDAELLARLGRADVELLAPIQHRGMEVQADLAVPRARDALVGCRTKLVNAIRGLAKSFGVQLPKCTAEGFHRHAKDQVPQTLKLAVKPLFDTLEQIEIAIKQSEKNIERLAKKYPDVELVSQPNGVGLLTGLVFVLTLEHSNRFEKSRTVGAFVGLRPRKNQSGHDDPELRITKAGDSFLRKLLVQCANYIMGPFGQDSDLRRWGLELASRGGKNARKRAKVAVARKLAVLMHRLWVTGEDYQPIGYGANKNAAAA